MKSLLKNMILWSGLLIYMILAFSFSSRKADEVICNKVDIRIIDSVNYQFVAPEDIDAILELNKLTSLGLVLPEIDTKKIESLVEKSSSVKDAEAYKTTDGVLHVKVKQRKPVARITDRHGNSYYFDQSGYIMPVSRKYSARVIFINGYIPEVVPKGFSGRITDLKASDQHKKILIDLLFFSEFLNSDPFWSRQFEQVYRNSEGEYELIPRVGAHVIYLGDLDKFEYKLFKLKALYKGGLNALGWNNYETINLKYSNQVICTKR